MSKDKSDKVYSCKKHGNSSIVYSGHTCPLCVTQEQIKYDNELIQSMHEKNGELLETIEKLNTSISKLMEEINQLKKED